MSHTVAVDDLKVGMFIHLDVGWMAHPFPLSSFRIASPEEIERIRGLGLKRLRWTPEKSRIEEPATEGAAPENTAAEHDAAAATAVEDVAPPPDPAALQREQLARQRAAARQCDEQYGEASGALRSIVSRALDKPVEVRDEAEGLTRALLDKMLGDREMCILVLSGNQGDKPTAHPMNVTVVSLLMARVLGLPEQDMLDVGVGALLHDIGKLELPHRVHHPDERFTQAEINAYRDHVRLGVALGQRMGLTPGALQVIAQHHECADGSGFPGRLNMDRMSPAARIVSMVNRYDNLCNPAAALRALTPHEALSRLFAQGRGKFDGSMLNAFIRMMGVYPAGSIVQLTDDRYGIVMNVNSSRPLKPRVLVHDLRVPRGEALLLNLASEPDLGIRRSLPLAQLPEAAREYLQPTPRVAYFFEPAAVTAGAG